MDITAAAVSGSKVSCDLTLPMPPAGETLDPTKVSVKYQMGGVAPGMTLLQVPAAADCTAAAGWFYDDNTTPTKIALCRAPWTSVQGDPSANVKVEVGCSTQIF